MKWLFKKITSIFKKKRTKVPVVPTGENEQNTSKKPTLIIATLPSNKSFVNKGSWKNPDYNYLWNTAEIDRKRVAEVKSVCRKIMQTKERYETVAMLVNPNMPWWFIAPLHYRESSLSFRGVLHNGEAILGTRKKTRLVPKGRGPFETWEQSAIDALILKRYNRHVDWDIANILDKCEKYNGVGYRYKGKGEYSPYMFGGTTHHDETGKYWKDGKFSATAPEKQLGVVAILKGLALYHGVKIG